MMSSTLAYGCARSDFITAVGGTDFNVSNMRTAANSRGDILVGGSYERLLSTGPGGGRRDLQPGPSIDIRAFAYLLKTDDCEVAWKYEFRPLKSAKAVAWSHDEKYAYLLGTSMTGEEGLIVFQ